jgi:hypothetical protein
MADVRRAWSRGLEVDQMHAACRYHLVRSLVSTARWDDALRAASPSPIPSRSELLCAAQRGDESLVGSVPFDVWYVLAAEQLASWNIVEVGRLRAQMARSWLAQHPHHQRVPRQRLLAARAWCALEDFDRAHALLRDVPSAWRRLDRLAASKLLADVQLLQGNLEPSVAAMSLHDPPSAAEQRFAAMVRGRRIAVVGPAPPVDDQSAAIDTHDVVIRTKFVAHELAPGAGSRTDIAYYSDPTARLSQGDIVTLLDSGQLRQAVLRPTAFRSPPLAVADASSVRYSPSEHGATFECTHFAIQRIVHDLIRYQPAAVSVFNATLFVGDVHYVSGYADDAQRHYLPNNLQPILSTAAHDLRTDFVFLQRLREAGFVHVDDRLGAVLDLTVEQYEQGLDRQRVEPPAESAR